MSESTIDFNNLTDMRPVRKKVPVPIPYDELQQIADESMKLAKSIDNLEAEKSMTVKGFTDRIKIKRERMSGLVQIYESKTREEEIDCVVGFDWNDTTEIVDEATGKVTECPHGKKYFASVRDGQLFGPEPITEADKQMEFKTGEWVTVGAPLGIEQRAEVIIGIDSSLKDDRDGDMTGVVFLRDNGDENGNMTVVRTMHFTGEENNAENVAKLVVEEAIDLREIKPRFRDAEIRTLDGELMNAIAEACLERADQTAKWMRAPKLMEPFIAPSEPAIDGEVVEDEGVSEPDQPQAEDAVEVSDEPVKRDQKKKKGSRRGRKSDASAEA